MSGAYVLQPAYSACEHRGAEPDRLKLVSTLLNAALPVASTASEFDELCARLAQIYWVETVPTPIAPDAGFPAPCAG